MTSIAGSKYEDVLQTVDDSIMALVTPNIPAGVRQMAFLDLWHRISWVSYTPLGHCSLSDFAYARTRASLAREYTDDECETITSMLGVKLYENLEKDQIHNLHDASRRPYTVLLKWLNTCLLRALIDKIRAHKAHGWIWVQEVSLEKLEAAYLKGGYARPAQDPLDALSFEEFEAEYGPYLTGRELTTLSMSAEGHSPEEIAESLSRTGRLINTKSVGRLLRRTQDKVRQLKECRERVSP